ncbi:MAG TPA: ATP/GTP-binding protein [Thiobacillaceae bacterium]|nr:ATP/GTP-binding protein [Thiobacillaceae bacterium]HNF87683.1 ATP/GTP-binding protein [Thiobacillaceae bacterium]HNH88598.1 ATP/GTP-binding protein [Thiobacillaceae bacterium]
MANYKIVFTGPVGAGKTTAINALSDVGTVGTDQRASDMTSHRKDKTTVAMDYGIMKIGDRERVHLYGTPGQERFDFMWDILSEGCIGLVLLLDNTRADPFKDLHFFLKAFPDYADSRRLAIGVTRMDVTRTPDLAAYYESLRPLQLVPPIFEVDARKRQDVATLVRALLYTIDPGLSE